MPVPQVPIQDTPSGVKVSLGSLYIYPDGHGNLTFANGANWPFADEYETVEWIVGKLLHPMLKHARWKARVSK